MKCPTCRQPLARVTYEGFNIQQCSACQGHLVASGRVEFIKGRGGKSLDELKAEVLAASGVDSMERLKCPGCLRQMEKRKLDPPADFYYDECVVCKQVWFDGGELARLKLGYQVSDQGKLASELQRRHQGMTPERKAELQADLQALPNPENDVAEIFRAAFLPKE